MTGGQGPASFVVLSRAALALSLISLLLGAHPAPAGSLDARMVADQVEARGIDDERVLEALRRVPRAAFVPPEARWRAHEDGPLPIGHGQTISQPYVVALMTSLLDVQPGHKVLEIGTGSGYQAAVLSLLARQVYSVEIVPELAASARLRLTRQGLRNIHVRSGDGNFGWEHYGPYDRVMVTAAAEQIPEALVDQLAEGGVLVMPVGDPKAVQLLVRGVKRNGKLHAHPVRKLRFVPLTGDVGASAPPPARRKPPPRRERPPDLEPPPDLREQDLSLAPRTDRRARPAGRIRAASAPSLRGGDRPCESGAGVRAARRSVRAGG